MKNTFDIDALLEELDSASICGANLEYDPQFVELEGVIQGRPEVQYGGSITEAVPPDWKLVRRLSLELLERSRDLRLAMALLRANLFIYGIQGLADGLRLIERLLDERWDAVHPELDAEDSMDPTLRINSLAGLADAVGVIQDIRVAPIVTLPGLGPLTIHVMEAAAGDAAVGGGEEKISVDSLRAALSDVNDVVLSVAVDALGRAHDSVSAIESLLVRQVGNTQALNLMPLVRMLHRAHVFLVELAPVIVVDEGQVETEVVEADGSTKGNSANGGARVAPISGEVANRDDVVRMLDKILRYYAHYEPSSPVPLLLTRAQRLVPKNFMEIMEDLAPDSLQQVMVFQGNAEGSQYH